ncbi:MAG: histidine--tRNA ligase [marine bacterium B5-7]|nr:MAG: histidine--tRNA ligase [marine bacterium B5-7]
MSRKIQSVRGMNDILPDQTYHWRHLESSLARICSLYGYEEIRPPLLERTELFKRSIGEATDIVEKEMYTFIDNNGESVTLRPEATASCVRAGVEHGLFHNQQAKLWYLGPMFRHEKPQKGRYRQFHQFGIEAIGWPGPDADAELQMFAARLFEEVGISSVTLEINTLGSPTSRTLFRDDLKEYLHRHEADLDEDSRRRLERNPLRILDSKVETTREILKDAPRLTNYLDEQSLADFNRLGQLLDAAGIAYRVNDRLVRGLDYYTSIVFEWVTDRLGAQGAVCAGGRYDGLIEQLSGRPAPAAGFALGIERLLELMQIEGNTVDAEVADIYLATLGDEAEIIGVSLAETLRNSELKVRNHLGGGNFKKQLKKADQSGARFALIIGEEEVTQQVVTVKDLRYETGQIKVPIDEIGAQLIGMLRANAGNPEYSKFEN